MIEEATIDGQSAVVAYLTRDLQPASKEAAEMIKIHFADGRIVFAFPSKQEGRE